jgi:hypothetical protein
MLKEWTTTERARVEVTQ